MKEWTDDELIEYVDEHGELPEDYLKQVEGAYQAMDGSGLFWLGTLLWAVCMILLFWR